MNVIESARLGKRYRRNEWALRDCTLGIPGGHIVALVGPPVGLEPPGGRRLGDQQLGRGTRRPAAQPGGPGHPGGELAGEHAEPAEPGHSRQETSRSPETFDDWLTQHGYTMWQSVQPGSRFWQFQLTEGGWLLGSAHY